MKYRTVTILLLAIVVSIAQPVFSQSKPLQLKAGSRVVFLGNTTIERAQRFGVWETLFLKCFADKKLTFRNLGWCGDTVWSDSRGLFDPPAKGYARMLTQVRDLKPSLILLGYGGNEAFAGAKGIQTFEAQLEKLLDDLGTTQAQVVILSPHRFENGGPPLPAPTVHNQNLKLYVNSLKKIAAKRSCYFVDLYNTLIPEQTAASRFQLTTNGVHLTQAGYKKAADIIAKDLGLHVTTLPSEVENKIQELSAEKNRLYFYNWRPQNITYLLLFRKHEQGNNAKELPEFIPLIEQKEVLIHRLLKQ